LIATTVVGFHACERAFAERLRSGELIIDDWAPSENEYDWLGPGIYFWEGGIRRAREFAVDSFRKIKDPMIVEADINLGRCFDLTETDYLDELRQTYDSLAELFREQNLSLPKNRGKRRDLDCLVIRQFLNLMENGLGDEVIHYQTVRCPFEEGEPVFPGSLIRRQTHIQIAVRDPRCIHLRNFRNV
jgi:hypothetical protein